MKVRDLNTCNINLAIMCNKSLYLTFIAFCLCAYYLSYPFDFKNTHLQALHKCMMKESLLNLQGKF